MIAVIIWIQNTNFCASLLQEIFYDISEEMFLTCQSIPELPSDACMFIFKMRY